MGNGIMPPHEGNIKIRLFGPPINGGTVKVSHSFIEKRRSYIYRKGKNPKGACTGPLPFSDYEYRPVEYVYDGDLGVAYVRGNPEKYDASIKNHFGDGVPVVVEGYVQKWREFRDQVYED